MVYGGEFSIKVCPDLSIGPSCKVSYKNPLPDDPYICAVGKT